MDVSVIATAPGTRRPVETRIARPSSDVLREAIEAEVSRGGQAYVVCPRISGVERIAEMWEEVGRYSQVVAHGRISGGTIWRSGCSASWRAASTSCCRRRSSRAGLDNPRANTMVVFDADQLGLTQLHQLRGRIGRSDVQAHMLLLTETDLDDDDDAARRLNAFARMSEMGDGFRIARMDRDIRGFGELDGDEQSGQLSRLGIGLYRHVLMGRVASDARCLSDRVA